MIKPEIRFPQNAEQVVTAYHRYLESIAEWSDMLPTIANAQTMADLILVPAWKRKDPILFACVKGRIIGATFTTLPDDRFAYRVPFASGHGTWVAPDWRNKGIAAMLLNRVREMLREKGVFRQVGIVQDGNDVSRAAFMKLGFVVDGTVLRYDL